MKKRNFMGIVGAVLGALVGIFIGGIAGMYIGGNFLSNMTMFGSTGYELGANFGIIVGLIIFIPLGIILGKKSINE
jgi:hypothetical protein